jgi:hypothetical protein
MPKVSGAKVSVRFDFAEGKRAVGELKKDYLMRVVECALCKKSWAEQPTPVQGHQLHNHARQHGVKGECIETEVTIPKWDKEAEAWTTATSVREHGVQKAAGSAGAGLRSRGGVQDRPTRRVGIVPRLVSVSGSPAVARCLHSEAGQRCPNGFHCSHGCGACYDHSSLRDAHVAKCAGVTSFRCGGPDGCGAHLALQSGATTAEQVAAFRSHVGSAQHGGQEPAGIVVEQRLYAADGKGVVPEGKDSGELSKVGKVAASRLGQHGVAFGSLGKPEPGTVRFLCGNVRSLGNKGTDVGEVALQSFCSGADLVEVWGQPGVQHDIGDCYLNDAQCLRADGYGGVGQFSLDCKSFRAVDVTSSCVARGPGTRGS